MSKESKYPSANNQLVALYLDTISIIPRVEFKDSDSEPDKILICTDVSTSNFEHMPKNLILTEYRSGQEPKSVSYVNVEYSKAKSECFGDKSSLPVEFFNSHILPFIKFIIKEHADDFMDKFLNPSIAIISNANEWNASITEVSTLQVRPSQMLKIVVELNNYENITITVDEFFDWIKDQGIEFLK